MSSIINIACPASRTIHAGRNWGHATIFRFAATAVAILLTLACGNGGGIQPADTTAARREALADTLKQLISAAYDFSTPGSVDRMMSLFAPGARVLSASDGSITISRDSINAGISRFWENVGVNMRNPVWKWGDVYVEPL